MRMLALLFALLFPLSVSAQEPFTPAPLQLRDFPTGFSEGASNNQPFVTEAGTIITGGTFGGTVAIPVHYSYTVASLPHEGAASGLAVDMYYSADPGGREAPRQIPVATLADESLWQRASYSLGGTPFDKFTVVLRSGSCAASLSLHAPTSTRLSPSILVPTAELLVARLSAAPECNRDE